MDFNDSSHGDITAELSAVSCGSNTSETEPEVMYTAIGAFHSSNFHLDDAARLSSVGTLCTLVTSAGHPLIPPPGEIVLETETKQSDDGEIKTTVSGIQIPISIQQEPFATDGLENNSKLDVSEFVVRSTGDDQDPISQHSTQTRTEVGETVLEGSKLTGGFDLCITSMMSHITSETGQEGLGSATKVLHPAVVSSDSGKRSRTLDFRDVHPEDQFAPPAVIFQVCLCAAYCTASPTYCPLRGSARVLENAVYMGIFISSIRYFDAKIGPFNIYLLFLHFDISRQFEWTFWI